jgi:hypothetical protein
VDSKFDRLFNRRNALAREIEGGEGKPARGKRLATLIARLRAMGPLVLEDSDAEFLIECYDQDPEFLIDQKARSRKKQRKAPELAASPRAPTGTDAAIDHCARGAGYIGRSVVEAMLMDGFEALLEQHREDLLYRGLPTNWPATTPSRGVVEDYPVLDIRALRRRELIRTGELTEWAMRWQGHGWNALLFVAADLRDEMFPHLLTHLAVPEYDTRQVIGLVDPGVRVRGRWLFMDPGSGRRCETLALRSGLLADYRTHNLVHASQVRGRGRVIKNPRRLKSASLGGVASLPPPGRTDLSSPPLRPMVSAPAPSQPGVPHPGGCRMSARRPKPKDLQEIIDIVASGRSLRSACGELGLDPLSTHKEIKDSDCWRPRYALACEIRAEFHAEQALQLCLAAALGRKIDGHSVDAAGARVALNAIRWHSAHVDPKGEPPTRSPVEPLEISIAAR